jgi:hypothetical protein
MNLLSASGRFCFFLFRSTDLRYPLVEKLTFSSSFISISLDEARSIVSGVEGLGYVFTSR